MNIEDIEPGKSYACNFKVRTFVDTAGSPVDTTKIGLGEKVPGFPGDYNGFGIITKRDAANRLLEVWDEACQRTWTVAWFDASNVDVVEWTDQD